MNVRSMLVVFALSLLSACAPYRIDHEHLVFDDNGALKIVERSTTAVDSQGEPLRGAKAGLPTKVLLVRERYEVHFELPPSSIPLLFLSARSPQGEVLDLTGAYLRRVHPDAEVLGYQYSFYVIEADGAPLEFVARGKDGVELGRERLTYKIRSRGVAYGIEWL